MTEQKRLLLIAPQFFGYDQLLSAFLKKSGIAVDLLPDRPVDSSMGKAAIRLNRKLFLPWADRFYRTKISALGRDGYDAILVIQGEALSTKTINWLRLRFPAAPLVWYLWDSFENKPSLKENLAYFDNVYTFDPQDAEKYRLKLRPLFYTPAYADIPERAVKYDLSFIGTGHADRYPIVRQLQAGLPQDRQFYRFIYMPSPVLYWLRRVFDPRLKSAPVTDFSFRKMPQSQVLEIIAQSEAVLDIQHPEQRGLTMRTLEALGARKKLVTTNPQIRDYDFYDENNIFIMDRQHPRIPQAFFGRPYRPLPADIYAKYSIREFLKSLLGPEILA